MLDLASVTDRDVVFDLGSGDGRIVIAAAVRGARAVGVDIDPSLVGRSQANALLAGLSHRTEFRCGSLFQADLGGATVVMLYLFQSVNLALRSKLQRELPAGARLISHSFDMGDWEPDSIVMVETKLLHLWTIAH